ncbi:hypothetical protein [Martelella radicis]|uniref:2-keto-3-deoxy-L-rhamnonate aldolase RhmA n=1 Tax=Martelella radicis TaxID=1397476 RepID=A0A7W6KH04_9HYPH|nr:hypothetical protein [Martelella radicis]MBB4121128.1 2-keto-3-deoxy-L-rhamnonate aldolase RhmA [Martelella radicis]
MSDDAPYRGIPNQFRRNILDRKVQIGCWSALASPITTEVLG